jgi:glucose/arabinose dehydrogenase
MFLQFQKILKYPNIERDIRNPPNPITIATFPSDRSHGWKYLKIHKNKLYVQVGVPCNTCNVNDPYGAMYEMNLDGSGMRKIAGGIRNSVGFEVDPENSNDLYFTDNGRDAWGDDKPGDELNLVKLNSTTKHYGFPFCYGKDLVDSQYNRQGNCNAYEPTFVDLGPHVAALGLTFISSTTFPQRFRGKLIIAEHGSWNRRTPIGYRVTIVDHKATNPKFDIFIDGWLQLPPNNNNNNENKDSRFAWGRPVDVINIPNGNILISDDKGNAIYEIYPQ